MFLPKANYALAEPTVNGLYGNRDSFPEQTFDIVVSCHVLEHIPEDSKNDFLEGLTSLAKKMVILLGPVADVEPGQAMTELTYEITKAPWAKEHLDCYLPRLENLARFAEHHGLHYSATPNSHRASVYWMVFAEHYARMAGKSAEFAQIAHFANNYLTETLTSATMPNDYLVILKKD